ncbi:TonB-dependent receptor domain-containing protein [Sphingobium sp.]|uniref:TonB-dependent receptor domain-containing protein n=1 Tax=Sphingobium sp. TaxID=1912891 RepID=UPI0028BD2E6D|nr:TonB-dependent receptor [Sphingobium sp.]
MKAIRQALGMSMQRMTLLAGTAILFAQGGAMAQQADASAQEKGPVATDPAPLANDIVVTGSRLGSRGFSAPTPVTTLGADDLEKRGLSGIGQAIAEYPAFRPSTTPSTNQLGSQQIGAIFADLRGLGPARTLVLVDGRRHVPTTLTGQVDLNVIPSILIKRADVVTGGASAAYGSDAVAGVLNLIMDSRFTGLKGELSSGISDEGDNAEYKASAAGGFSFAGGRGHVIVGGEYYKSRGTGDAYSRRWGREEWQQIRNPNWPANGLPNRILTPNAHFTSLAEGGLITSGRLAGTTFLPNGTPVAFQYGTLAGTQYQIGGDGYGETFLKGIYLSVPVERFNGFTHAEFDVSDALTLFGELSYSKSVGRSHGPQPRDQGSITILRGNAYLPPQLATMMDNAGVTSFKMGRLSTDLGFPNARSVTPALRAVGGVKGDLDSVWSYDAYFQYGHVNYSSTIDGVRVESRWAQAYDAVRNAQGIVICRSTLTNPGNGCVPVNLFGNGSISAAAQDYLTETQWTRRRITQQVAAANLRGSPFSTWAGDVSLAFGGEWRRDEVDADSDAISQVNGFNFGNPKPIDGRITVKEAYLEVGIPLLRDSALGKALDLNGAVRRTDYSTSGAVTTWKIGGTYSPVDGVRLRATKSRDIRAPNISELFTGSQFGTTQVIDAVTGSQRLTQTMTTGNLGLSPESSDTFTAGLVLEPAFAPGLRFSADYYDVNIKGAIASLGAQTLVDRCNAGASEFCQYIARGSDGLISTITLAQLNLNRVRTRGIDFEFDYRLPLSTIIGSSDASLGFRVVANYAIDLITTDSSGSINRAGQTGLAVGATGGVPRYTLNGTVTYSDGPFTLSTNMRYIPQGKYDVTLVGPQDKGYSPTLVNSINDNRVSSAFYTNLSLDYAVGEDAKVHVFGVVNNLFDKDPPVSPGTTVTNPVLFDVIGRSYRVGVRFAI